MEAKDKETNKSHLICTNRIAKEICKWLKGEGALFLGLNKAKTEFRNILAFTGFPLPDDILIFQSAIGEIENTYNCKFAQKDIYFSFTLDGENICIKKGTERSVYRVKWMNNVPVITLISKKEKTSFGVIEEKYGASYNCTLEAIYNNKGIQLSVDLMRGNLMAKVTSYCITKGTVLPFFKEIVGVIATELKYYFQREEVKEKSIDQVYREIYPYLKKVSNHIITVDLSFSSFDYNEGEPRWKCTDQIKFCMCEVVVLTVTKNGKTITSTVDGRRSYLEESKSGKINMQLSSTDVVNFNMEESSNFYANLTEKMQTIPKEIEDVVSMRMALPKFDKKD